MTIRASALALSLAVSLAAVPALAQQVTLPLWPHVTPEPAQTTLHETDVTQPTDALISGRRTARLTNVTHPTLSVYPPRGHNSGAAAVVFPGGGYQRLAWDGEGLDACRWLNSLGMTCLLVKYRVPQPDGDAGHYPADPADLEDAQQAMRLARSHASDWRLDPAKIGVMGFSAGANLAVLLSTHPDDDHIASTPAAPDAPLTVDARPNFAILVYPAYLPAAPAQTSLNPVYAPNRFTPPTFLIQAEDDKSYSRNALVYYRALLDAHIPAELHYFATGGHGFGMNPVGAPEEHWPRLAAAWLRTTGILPIQTLDHPADTGRSNAAGTTNPNPCPADMAPTGNATPKPKASDDPACW